MCFHKVLFKRSRDEDNSLPPFSQNLQLSDLLFIWKYKYVRILLSAALNRHTERSFTELWVFDSGGCVKMLRLWKRGKSCTFESSQLFAFFCSFRKHWLVQSVSAHCSSPAGQPAGHGLSHVERLKPDSSGSERLHTNNQRETESGVSGQMLWRQFVIKTIQTPLTLKVTCHRNALFTLCVASSEGWWESQLSLVMSWWFLKFYRETQWDTERHSKTQWNILKHSGTQWDTERHSETYWNILKHSETQWDTERHSETYWNTVGHSEAQWDTVGHIETQIKMTTQIIQVKWYQICLDTLFALQLQPLASRGNEGAVITTSHRMNLVI